MGKCKCGVEGLRFNGRGVLSGGARISEKRLLPVGRFKGTARLQVRQSSIQRGARSIVVVIAKGMPAKEEFGIYDRTVRIHSRAIH